RVVGAALDGCVVADDKHLAPRNPANAGDDAGARCFVVVHLGRRQWRELEERRTRIEQAVDSLAHRELALLAVPLEVARTAALASARDPLAELRDERGHPRVIGLELGAVSLDARWKRLHLPSAAVRLETAFRAAPDGVHAVHLRLAAPLANHLVDV